MDYKDAINQINCWYEDGLNSIPKYLKLVRDDFKVFFVSQVVEDHFYSRRLLTLIENDTILDREKTLVMEYFEEKQREFERKLYVLFPDGIIQWHTK